ncbi:MAG: hypothetical protein E6044_09315, partial [Actinomyces sp.]|nr:hypothetical protein [Actinomyces sp.]
MNPLDAIPGHLEAAEGKASAAAKAFPDFLSGLGEDLRTRASYVGDAFSSLGEDLRTRASYVGDAF